MNRHVFGPVASRRLGRSLGIDPVRHKSCQLDCIYCECGPTPLTTLARQRFFPPEELLEELERVLATIPPPDWITFGGAGEPLLSADFSRFSTVIKARHPEIPQALLTNSVLLDDREIRAGINTLDLILPSLDAVSEEIFRAVNRPHPGLTADTLIRNLVRTRELFHGEIWLEIFVLPGINDSDAELALFREALGRIRPDRIQLNSLDRPGAVTKVPRAGARELLAFRERLALPGTEIISRDFLPDADEDKIEAQILHAVDRRRCTSPELAGVTALGQDELEARLQILAERGALAVMEQNGERYYCRRKPWQPPS